MDDAVLESVEPEGGVGAGAGGEATAGLDGTSEAASSGGGEDDEDGRPAPSSIWRNRDYLAWWIGTSVFSLGSSMSSLAYPLLMLYETGSVAQAGVIAACENVGRLVTMLIGGVLADRVSRKALLVWTPLIQGAAVGSVVPLVLTHHVSVYSIGAIAAVQGLISGLGSGAVLPSLKRIVPARQFPAVSASRQARDQAASLVGPPLGGALFAFARWMPFLGDALSFLASALGSALIRTPLGPDGERGGARREPMRRDLAAGFAFVRSNAYMRFVTAWAALINGLFSALLLLLLALARHRGGGPVAVGALTSITAIGALIGALAAPWLVKRVPGRLVVVLASWILAAGVVVSAYVPRPWEIGAVFAVVFLFVPPLNTVFDTYEMRVVPDELYGRVSSLINFLCGGLMWIGPIVAGLLADAFSPVTAVVIIGGALALMAVWVQGAKALHVLNERPQ